jgi:hypothetical protein
MASIENTIDNFISENELDPEIKESLSMLVNQCIEGLFKHFYSEPIQSTLATSMTKSVKVSKADKVEDPTTVQSMEELRNCTIACLNEYCKNHGLKIGGNKPIVMTRVWRHIQGEVSDEDKSPKNKPKKIKAVNEKHTCSGVNAKGEPCAVAGTEEHDGCWYCWRHITSVSSQPASKVEEKVTPPPAPKAEKKPKASGKVKKIVEKIEQPVESDSQLESDEE